MHKTWAMRTGEMSFMFSFPHSIPLLYSAFWCSSLVVRNHGLRIVGAEELKAFTRMNLMYFSNFSFKVGFDKRYAKVRSQKLICAARVDRKRQRPLILKFPGQSTLYETLGPLFRQASETLLCRPRAPASKNERPQPSLLSQSVDVRTALPFQCHVPTSASTVRSRLPGTSTKYQVPGTICYNQP
jgi:hypothetical protein